MSLISVVIPVFNEEGNLGALYQRLSALEAGGGDRYELLFLDDGSRDASREIVRSLAEKDPRVRYLFFSRNFGHEQATTAGLDHVRGDAAVIIDSDLQDPPELIPEMVRKWREGYQVVYAQRRARKGESVFKKLTSWFFYRLVRMTSDCDIPRDTGDFLLIDRRVVGEFRRCREQNRFVRGLIAWTGFRQIAIPYDRDERLSGQTKYSVIKLIRLAFDAILGFSTLPLRAGLILGLLVSVVAFVEMCRVLYAKLVTGLPIPGYALQTTAILLLGGVQLVVIGLVGSYVGRIYRQSQNRPLYVVAEESEGPAASLEPQQAGKRADPKHEGSSGAGSK
jgi:polyisoprenyl-phosphate glycosyltransferase